MLFLVKSDELDGRRTTDDDDDDDGGVDSAAIGAGGEKANADARTVKRETFLERRSKPRMGLMVGETETETKTTERIN